ncbi:MAG: AsmA-like C-terminal region-containing protein [Stappiaceae bacterium]
MKRRRLKNLFLLLVAMVLLALAGLYAVLTAPVFLSARQDLAGQFLSDLFDRQITVVGSVDIDPGVEIGFRISDVEIKAAGADADSNRRQFVDEVGFTLPYAFLTGASDDARRFSISGARIVFDVAKRPDTRLEVPDRLISHFLENEIASDLSVHNVAYIFRDIANGWEETVRIDDLSMKLSADSRQISMTGAGYLNETPLSATGNFSNPHFPSGAAGNHLDISVQTKGATLGLSALLFEESGKETIQGDLTLTIASIGSALESFGIERAIDGKMVLAADIHGRPGHLSLSNLEAKGTSSTGQRLIIGGQLGDLNEGRDIDLAFQVVLTLLNPVGTPKSVHDLEITGYQGRVVGDLGALALQAFHLHTNVANLELQDIGPISIKRIIKDEKDRIGLQGITILDGPPQDRTMVLSGEIGDLLRLAEVNIGGHFNMPVSEILFTNAPDVSAPALGRLKGTVLITDEGGSIGIQDLDAKVVETGLYDLSLKAALDELRRMDALDLAVTLVTPDLSAFAQALGMPIQKAGAVRYEGSVKIRDASVDLKGDLTLQKSRIASALHVKGEAPSTEIDGTIKSDLLRMPALRIVVDALSNLKPSASAGDIIQALPDDDIKLVLELDIKKLTDGRKAAGNIKGKLHYQDERASLSPFHLSYLGGQISGDYAADLSGRVPVFSGKGRVDKWRLGTLLKELGISAPVTGTFYMSYDGSIVGTTMRSWVRSLNGRITASLWGGRVQGRVLDLTGLNLVTWLFAKHDKSNTAKLVCAVAPLRVKNGVAHGKSIVIETDNVQIVGGGSINFKTGALGLSFMPRPKRKQAIDIVTPFSIDGTMQHPKVIAHKGRGSRAFAEVVSMPINLIGRIFGGGKLVNPKQKPCRIPANRGPK